VKRFIIAFLIILLFPVMAFAQLSLNSINTDLHTNYHNITTYQAYVNAQGFLKAANLTAYRLVVDSYSTSEVDTLLNAKLNASVINDYYTAVTTDMFLSLKANSADVYTTGAVDLLLLAKLDTAALIPYYTALQVDAKLLDYATTGSVALKASQIQVDSEAVALQSHIGNLATHGHNSPVGQPSNRLEVTDGAGGWQFTSVAAAGGGVTNAVDLNSSTASFTRLMNSLASNAQTALNQIDQNAATTAEVAAKANAADVYTKSETNDTIANAINAIPPPDFTNYYTKAQTNSTIENAIAAATASVTLAYKAYSNGTDETQATAIANRYTKAETNATIENRIAAIPAASSDLVKIEKITANGSASTCTFSTGLSSTYNSYKIVIHGGYASNDKLCLNFNGDTTSNNYSYALSEGNTSGMNVFSDNNSAAFIRITWSLNSFMGDIVIGNNGTTDHMVCSNVATTNSTSSYATNGGGRWKSNAAITSITLSTASSTNFTSGSTFSLYGLK